MSYQNVTLKINYQLLTSGLKKSPTLFELTIQSIQYVLCLAYQHIYFKVPLVFISAHLFNFVSQNFFRFFYRKKKRFSSNIFAFRFKSKLQMVLKKNLIFSLLLLLLSSIFFIIINLYLISIPFELLMIRV